MHGVLSLFSLAGLLCVAFVFCAAAAENPGLGEDGWKTYLAPKEGATLAETKNQLREWLEKTGRESAIEAAALPAIRSSFKGPPPIPSVKSARHDADGVRGLWQTPEGAAEDRVILFFHGGGYVIGNPELNEATTGYLAKSAGVSCFSLAYPLAPESPYPAALDNAVLAYRMLLNKGVKPDNIVVSGGSAGGGLAVALLLRLREEGIPLPAGAYLLSPWTDLTNSFATHREKMAVEPGVGIGLLRSSAEMYAKGRDLRDPFLSPAFADLRGLPPILVHVGSHEILLDDSLALIQNAALADVPASVKVWPGYFHMFQGDPNLLEGARKSLDEGAAFVNAVMDKTWLRPDGE